MHPDVSEPKHEFSDEIYIRLNIKDRMSKRWEDISFCINVSPPKTQRTGYRLNLPCEKEWSEEDYPSSSHFRRLRKK